MFETVLYLTLLLPLAASLIIGLNLLFGEIILDWRQIQRIAVSALFLSMIGSLYLFINVLENPTPREITAYTWFEIANLKVEVGFLVDFLSALMALMITGFSFLIGVFSINYMHKDPSFSRYFSTMMLFVFAMLLLVLGNNFILLFVGWESVGLCSYLLIGHYYSRKSAASAGTKAFVMNRVGDAGFLAGIFLIVQNFGTVKYSEIFSRLSEIDNVMATAICLCLLAGAIGKSAQFPLGTWLARAMEGPTPSSALIHAATMVTAGIYMIVRSHELYDMAPVALAVVTIVGALTAVYGGLTGMANTDIKGILASSTVTQLGLMFVACGLGAYPVAVFHMVAHAFLKTFLFLTAPSILHYFHTFPDPKAGNVESANQPVPIMFWFVLIGSIGLIGTAYGITAFNGQNGLQPSYYLLTGVFLMGLFTTLRHAISATQRIFSDHKHNIDHDCSHISSNTKTSAPVLIPLTFVIICTVIAALIGLLPGGLPNSWFQSLLAPVVNISPLANSGTVLSWIVIAVLGLLMLTAWSASIYTERFAPELPGDGLLNTRAIYVAAQKRFWLDDFYHKFIVGKVVIMGRSLDTFDQNAINKIIGKPSQKKQSFDINNAWETNFLAARANGLVVDDVGSKSSKETGLLTKLQELDKETNIQSLSRQLDSGHSRASGLLGFIMEIAANASEWVERKVFERFHGGVARTGGIFGDALYRIEELLGKPVLLGMIAIVVWSAIILGVIS